MGAGPLGFALDANGGERLAFGDVTVLIRASAETTGGAFTVIEEVPPMVDTPLHVHAQEDEMFYVLEGEHIVQCGDQEFHLGPGGVVFLRAASHIPNGASCRGRDGCSS